jgi:ADP-heptose:LPS heptosyltransferase
MNQLIEGLCQYDQVMNFDTPKPNEPPCREGEPLIYDLTTTRPALTFAQSAAVLADCDLVIAPDSALCHVAGALRIPTLALYGPFPWELRTLHAPTIQGLNGTGCPIAPCHWHDRSSHFPPNGPCHKTHRCEALASLEPQMLIQRAKEMLKARLAAKMQDA